MLDTNVFVAYITTIKKQKPYALNSGKISKTTTMGQLPNPLMDKVTPEHITKILDESYRNGEYSYNYSRSNRWFNLVYTLGFIGVFIFLIIFLLPSKEEVFFKLINTLIPVLGAFGAGYGYKVYRDRKK